MRIGLLECDHVADKYLSISGTYPQMFANLLPEIEWVTFDVVNGQFPNSIDDCDGYICTGSKYSVYQDMEWIQRLKAFIAALYKNQKKFIGVCFGHQMLAEALGGAVLKSEKGWNVGIHAFEVLAEAEWMRPFKKQFQLLMMCQDQVSTLPKNAKILAESDNCSVGMFKVGETMLGIQAHPEFSVAYEKALMLDRIDRIGKEKVEQGVGSLEKSLDKKLLADWMMHFLE